MLRRLQYRIRSCQHEFRTHIHLISYGEIMNRIPPCFRTLEPYSFLNMVILRPAKLVHFSLFLFNLNAMTIWLLLYTCTFFPSKARPTSFIVLDPAKTWFVTHGVCYVICLWYKQSQKCGMFNGRRFVYYR